MNILFSSQQDHELEFDVVGVQPAIVNAFRRLMLSEVPSMAIDRVYIYNNTSIIQDEVLAHRLGLIPLKADSRLFEFRAEDFDSDNNGTEHDTLEFELKVKCTRKVKDNVESANFDTLYKNHNIYSHQIKWCPIGKQKEVYNETDIGPINDDILISKMRPGHELDIRMLAVKGIGKDHAKFSPVSTATYRLLPEITLKRTVAGNDAKLLQKCFSAGVVGINDIGEAYIENARYDLCSRNVFRYPQLSDAVTMSRVRNHFIFNVETVGSLPPGQIFIESVKLLRKKCRQFLDDLQSN